MASLGENGLAKDLGFPIDCVFFYSQVPDKDQQSGCSIFSPDITGREKGEKRLEMLFASCIGQWQGWLFIGKNRLDSL